MLKCSFCYGDVEDYREMEEVGGIWCCKKCQQVFKPIVEMYQSSSSGNEIAYIASSQQEKSDNPSE